MANPTTPLDDLGRRLIALGQAMRDGKTTMSELIDLAQACGTKLHVRLVPDHLRDEAEQQTTQNPGSSRTALTPLSRGVAHG